MTWKRFGRSKGLAFAALVGLLAGCAARRPVQLEAPRVSTAPVPTQTFFLVWDWPACDGAGLEWCRFWNARAVLEWATNVQGPWHRIATCEPAVRRTNVIVPRVPVGFFRIGATISP